MGAALLTDGVFGALTEAAVRLPASQRAPGDRRRRRTTADRLGVRAYTGGYPGGWTWSGWGFNNSYTLVGWESRLVANQEKIGPVSKGTIKSLPGAQALFEGFVREIVTGGYPIKDLGTYVFRCTSNSRKDCQGLHGRRSPTTPTASPSTSTTANPELRYANCQTPVTSTSHSGSCRPPRSGGCTGVGTAGARGARPRTTRHRDHPRQHALRVPRHAGASGCDPRRQRRTRRCPHRDATPTWTAAGRRPVCASTAHGHPLAPASSSTPARRPVRRGAGQHHRRHPAAAGYVTAEACGAAPAGDRGSSNGNYAAGQTVANLSVVPVDARGWFCVYTSAPAHVVVDVQGYLTPGGGSLLHVVEPRRVTDTRTVRPAARTGRARRAGPIPAGAVQQVDVAGIDGATGVLANLTVTNPRAPATSPPIPARRCSRGSRSARTPTTPAGATVANLAVVPTRWRPRRSVAVHVRRPAGQHHRRRAGLLRPGCAADWASRLRPPSGSSTPAVATAAGAGSITRCRRRRVSPPCWSTSRSRTAPSAGYVTADRCSVLAPAEQTRATATSHPVARWPTSRSCPSMPTVRSASTPRQR